jgi:hypothetical protein
MAIASSNTVVGVFNDRTQADRAIDALYNAGFRSDQIGVVMRDQGGASVQTGATSTSDLDVDDGATNAGTGAAAGAAAGVGIGGLIGLGVISGVVPVIGPAIAGGTLAGILLSNAAAGAAVAGLAGSLIGWGVSDEDARYYESEFSSGRAVVTVSAGARDDEARQILRSYGATSRDPAFASRT